MQGVTLFNEVACGPSSCGAWSHEASETRPMSARSIMREGPFSVQCACQQIAFGRVKANVRFARS